MPKLLLYNKQVEIWFFKRNLLITTKCQDLYETFVASSSLDVMCIPVAKMGNSGKEMFSGLHTWVERLEERGEEAKFVYAATNTTPPLWF